MYDKPYVEDTAASKAIHSTMEHVDWKALLQTVDERFESWRKPTMVLYGNRVRAAPAHTIWIACTASVQSAAWALAVPAVMHRPPSERCAATHSSVRSRLRTSSCTHPSS